MGFTVLLFCCLVATITSQTSRQRPKELLVLTVATDTNHDGYVQFLESVEKHQLKLQTIGDGIQWNGGDIANKPGGGQKINLSKKVMEEYKEREDLVVLFTDSYDAIMHGGESEILERFMEFNCAVLFSAEVFVWPDPKLAVKYPPVRTGESRYLNSGGYMGYAPDVYKMLTAHEIADTDDDQLYFTNVFLDEYQSILNGGGSMYTEGSSTMAPADALAKMTIRLDTGSAIFQTLNGVLDQVEVKYKNRGSFLYNTATGSSPLVIHGNGPIKHKFNRMVSYLNDAWTPTDGCIACKSNRIDVSDPSKLPDIFMTLMVEDSTPFLFFWLDRITALSYPKDKLDVVMHNRIPYHEKLVSEWVEKNKGLYKSFEYLDSTQNLDQQEAKNLVMKKALDRNVEYFLSIDSLAQLTTDYTIQDLLSYNRSCITPLMLRPSMKYSTFWAECSDNGYYVRGPNYDDIVTYNQTGVWIVPYTAGVHLIKGKKLKLLPADPYNAGPRFPPSDYDVAFAYNARKYGLMTSVVNMDYYGHLINPDNFDVARTVPELHETENNRKDWELYYLHPQYYSMTVNESHKLEQPCPDVFWFPIFNDRFCDDLVKTMETFGKWSGGTNSDPRLAGGYENVPTRDIHMNQVGLESQWLSILRTYVQPVQLMYFQGYHSTLNAIMNFVVRYRPDEQPSLRPHHDSSTFTVNLALNTRDVDYEGGGVRFLRYNCTLLNLRKGWMLMHPGRLTHYHEGLKTTKGTRYIMVSFVNP